MSFSQELKIFREAQEMTQLDFAKRLGISTQYQCDLEGSRRNPSVQYVERLCEAHSRGPKGRLFWHRLGAAAHGWKVTEERKG
jgi:transcriptional regulator with XRE-family HTH domain